MLNLVPRTFLKNVNVWGCVHMQHEQVQLVYNR
jgi:hypothetical protein